MPRERQQLSKEPINGNKTRYKRMVKGEIFKSSVFPCDSRANRQAAWNQFEMWRDERRDDEERKSEVLDIIAEIARSQSGVGGPAWGVHKLLIEQAAMSNRISEMYKQAEVNPVAALEVAKATAEEVKPQDELRLSKRIDAIANYYKSKAVSGSGSVGRYDQFRLIAGHVLDIVGDVSLAEINEGTVTNLYHTLLERIANGYNECTADQIFKTFRQIVKWSAEDFEGVVIPRNLNSRRHRIAVPIREVKVFNAKEVNFLLDNVAEKTQLYFLLMLNCGFTQIDVADLKLSEIDSENGRIIRARSKTKQIKVNWLLWDRTFELLKRYSEEDGDLALLTKHGKQLVRNQIKADGKRSRADAVKEQFSNALKRLDLPADWEPGRGLKHLRKTGADMIETSEEYGEFVELYLDHASVAKRHYLRHGKVVPRFDAAIRWLGEQFGFSTTR